jgi:hypothetical protein
MIFLASLLIGQSPPTVGGEVVSCSQYFRAELQPSRFIRSEFCQKAVGAMHPNLWMTLGGMGSKRLSGLNISTLPKMTRIRERISIRSFAVRSKLKLLSFQLRVSHSAENVEVQVQCNSCQARRPLRRRF